MMDIAIVIIQWYKSCPRISDKNSGSLTVGFYRVKWDSVYDVMNSLYLK